MSDWTDGPVRVLVGDVRGRLAELPDESVHTVVTSPPYWGLRDYGTAEWEGGDDECDHRTRTSDGPKQTPGVSPNGHAAKADRVGPFCGRCGARRVDQQLGLEATPEQYVAHMVEVFREVRRALRSDGTLWLNLGDSYATGTNADRRPTMTAGSKVPASWSNRNQSVRRHPPGLKSKDLVMMPARVALALQADGWWLRSEITWCKAAPMPESVRDRPTSATEKVFLLSKSKVYYYDTEAVREAAVKGADGSSFTNGKTGVNGAGRIGQLPRVESGSRNMRNYWLLGPEPFPEAHFAVFPSEIPRRCIAAGTSERGCCPECGAPWRRMTSVEYVRSPVHGNGSVVGRHYATGQNNFDGAGMPRVNKNVTTTGWQPTCAHDAEPVPCTVLDPFAGSGTTLAVARRMGRRAIGIELQPDYLPLIQRRVAEAALPLLEAIP